MSQAATYQEFVLFYAGKVAHLRPTLRCAIQMEAMHNGFPTLLKKLEQFDTATVAAIITSAAPRNEAEGFLANAQNAPVQSYMLATQAQLFRLVAALLPTATDSTTDAPSAPQTHVPWSKVYADLFGFATGWLGWTPQEAWQATPTEITQAFIAHTDKLKAMNGGTEPADNTVTEEQRQTNIDAGLDPDFDRQGLQALRGMGSANE